MSDDWMPGVSVLVLDVLQDRCGRDFDRAFELWKEIDGFQVVKIGRLSFQLRMEDRRYFAFCLLPDSNLYQVWGPASLVGALFLMGVWRMTPEEMLEALISFAESYSYKA